jgi:hypothetical protein
MTEEEASKIHGYTVGYVDAYWSEKNKKIKRDVPDVYFDIATNMSEIMRKQRICSMTLARKTGINVGNICRYLNCTRKMGVDSLVQIAKALNVSVDRLIETE